MLYSTTHVRRHFNNFSVRLQQRLARSLRNLRNVETFRYQIVLRRKGKINGLVARWSESFRCHKRKFHDSRRVTFSLKPKSCLSGAANVKQLQGEGSKGDLYKDLQQKTPKSRAWNIIARGSAVGRGNMLRAGRSRVRFSISSLDCSIDLILPAVLWSWGRLSL
jgi:hypothetical protein